MQISRRNFIAASGSAAFAALIATPLRAQPPLLRPAAMRHDLDLFERAYAMLHPGLTRYITAGRFAADVAAGRTWAAQERSQSDFFLLLARLSANVRCGHSYPNPNNQRAALREALLSGRDAVPFAFRWIGSRMIVLPGGAAPDIAPGTEILSLDGVPARRLLARMTPLMRADGANDAKRRQLLGVDGFSRFPAFDVYRPMLFPPPAPGRVRIEMRAPNGSRIVREMPTGTEVRPAAADGDAPLWQFSIRADGVGLLRMRTWTVYNSSWNWQNFLDEAIDRLVSERARGLIVDIRGNEGGTECGWHLMERLVARPTPLPRYRRRTRYRRVPTDFAGALDTWDPSFRDWGERAAGPADDGFYDLESGDAAAIAPRGRRFDGPVKVLIDSACSSATFQFAQAIRASGRASGRARLVGEPTGGNRRGINGGAYFFVRLPETGMEVDLPLIGYFPERPQPDAGLQPDIAILPTARDIAEGRDRAMDAALREIARA